MTFTVANSGNAPAPSTVATIRLGSVTTVTDQTPLLTDVTVPALGTGQFQTFNQPVTIPTGTVAGSYYLGVTANDTPGIGQSCVALPVPLFKQTDSRWSGDPMIDENGVNQGTVGVYGCAMSSAAMVAAYYGTNTDPGQLDTWLNNNSGYESGGYIYWQKAADYTAGKMAYQSSLAWTGSYGNGAGAAQWATLQSQLSLGRPVIVEEYLSSTRTHWIVVTGFAGGSVTDPRSTRSMTRVSANSFFGRVTKHSTRSGCTVALTVSCRKVI